MATRKKIKQIIPMCIFCGNSPLTEEHFWPNWMKHIGPKDGPNHHSQESFFTDLFNPSSPKNTSLSRKITGPPKSRKLKVVCKACNNGWMSQIENKAKPILMSLIHGEDIELDTSVQDILSKWAFLKTIIGESKDTSVKAITKPERIYFMENQVIPPNWMVWIGRTPFPVWNYWHEQKATNAILEGKITGKSFQHKGKSSTMIVGELILYIARFSVSEFGFDENRLRYHIIGDYANKLTRLHPTETSTVQWEGFVPITDFEIHQLYGNLMTFANQIRARVESI